MPAKGCTKPHFVSKAALAAAVEAVKARGGGWRDVAAALGVPTNTARSTGSRIGLRLQDGDRAPTCKRTFAAAFARVAESGGGWQDVADAMGIKLRTAQSIGRNMGLRLGDVPGSRIAQSHLMAEARRDGGAHA